MEEKYCAWCGKYKPVESFHKDRSRASGVGTYCKECKITRRLNDPRPHREANRRRKVRITLQLREYKMAQGCLRCNENDWLALDFHHLDPSKKEHSLDYLANKNAGQAIVDAEIAKCVVLCANCHRKFHGGRFTITEDRRIVEQTEG